MKKLSKHIALLACLALIAGLLPMSTVAADTVSEADLRANVIARTQAIMDVDWSIQSRMAKANIAGDQLAAWKAAGIHPTTYFEYDRLHFPFKGVMVHDNAATLEEFAAMAKMEYSKVEGIPHNIYAPAEQKGMDINSFLTDITTHVLDKPLNGLKAALTDPQLTALAQGADFSAASSKAAISYEAAKAGYAKLSAGDLLLAWDNDADAVEGGHPRIHALVVKEVSGEQVTVLYPAFSLVLWYFKCSSCGLIETEGPTSAALPEHIASDGYSFGSLKKHGGCGGEWTPMYGTTWRTETVSLDALYGKNAEVPYGSFGYLPYTLNVYAQGAKAADIKVSTAIDAENYLSGFTADITSDRAITSVKAEITRDGQVVASDTMAPARGAKQVAFASAKLDDALRRCPTGTRNTLALYVRSGPLDAQGLAQDSYAKVFTLDFTVRDDAAKLVADKTFVQQGEQFGVSVNTAVDGITGLQAGVFYDAASYVFELEASRIANPGVTFEDNGSKVTATRLGKAMAAGSQAVRLVFHAKRTGEFPMEAKDNGQIYCASLAVTDKANPTVADLKVSKADATPIQLATGYNTVIYKDYVAGYDMLVLFTATAEQKNNTTTSVVNAAYDGKPMYDVTTARYEPGEGDIQRVYAVLTVAADPAKVSIGTEACQQLAYDLDVNRSGLADLNDVQAISNIIQGNMPLDGNEQRWLFADIDRSGKVDSADMTALWNKLLG